LNDYIVTSAALAASQIAKNAKFMQVSIPFTLKDYPSKLSELRLGNDFACLPFKMPFPETRDLTSFNLMLKEQQRAVRDKRNIFLGLGFYYMMNYFVGLLRFDMIHHPRKICNNYTTVFSCVPGPKKSWCFGGLKV